MSPGKAIGPAGNGAEQRNQVGAGSPVSLSGLDAASAEYLAGLARRRDAARRLAPLKSGALDPWAPNPRPAARSWRGHHAVLVNDGRGAYVFLRCSRELAQHVADDLGVPRPEWASAGAGYAFRRSLFRDLVAALEYAGASVRLTDRRRRDRAS